MFGDCRINALHGETAVFLHDIALASFVKHTLVAYQVGFQEPIGQAG